MKRNSQKRTVLKKILSLPAITPEEVKSLQLENGGLLIPACVRERKDGRYFLLFQRDNVTDREYFPDATENAGRALIILPEDNPTDL